jgi:hypothetical protein
LISAWGTDFLSIAIMSTPASYSVVTWDSSSAGKKYQSMKLATIAEIKNARSYASTPH